MRDTIHFKSNPEPRKSSIYKPLPLEADERVEERAGTSGFYTFGEGMRDEHPS